MLLKRAEASRAQIERSFLQRASDLLEARQASAVAGRQIPEGQRQDHDDRCAGQIDRRLVEGHRKAKSKEHPRNSAGQNGQEIKQTIDAQLACVPPDKPRIMRRTAAAMEENSA